MTTSANDETKKDAPLPENGTAPDSDDVSPAVPPKKKKRKRKPKKTVAVSPVTENLEKTAEKTEEKTPKETPHKETKKEAAPEKKASTEKEEKSEEDTKEEKTEKPNLDIKSDTHMLPGIDNINEYIARKKATPSAGTDKKDMTSSLVAADGTELLEISGLYAIVPHAKGDHKLVYLTKDMPEGLLDDPRKRVPGSMYVKNGHDIYMVNVTMKEHPTLKNAHNESYDVWLIDDPEELTKQVEAIKKGKGGGENFSAPVLVSLAASSTIAAPVVSPEATDLATQPEEEIKETTQDTSVPEESSIETLPEDENTPTQREDSSENNSEAASLPDLDKLEQSSQEDTASIDLSLPEDTDILEQEPDIDSALPENDESQEPTNGTDETDLPDEEGISLDGMEEDTESNEPASEDNTSETIHDQATLEQKTEDTTPPENEETSEHHFVAPIKDESATSLDDLGIEEESQGHPLFGTEEATPEKESPHDEPIATEEQTSMFREPVAPAAEETPVDSPEEISTEPMFAAHHTPTYDTQERPSEEVGSETPLPPEEPEAEASSEVSSETESDSNTIDLDTLSIDTSAQGGIDLDSMATNEPPTPASAAAAKDTAAKKSTFPFAIVIRIVLFLVIIGALILVWKVMFPTIKGTKPVDQNPVNTGQVIDETENDVIIPPTDIDPEEEIPALPPVEETPPAGGVTLNELTEKLKIQQTEARKLLNMAKLLENKDAIKFSLAAMLKAGNVLERISTEPTITAEDVLKETEKVDAYLMEATQRVE